jgi:hypothetical protein
VGDLDRAGVGEVEADAQLAGVEVAEQHRRLEAGHLVLERGERAAGLDAGVRLDAHHRRPEVGEHATRGRPRHHPHEVEHVQPGERTRCSLRVDPVGGPIA